MRIDAKKDGEYTRLEIQPDSMAQGADYIAIVRGEGKEDVYFTNTMSPFGGAYTEMQGKYIRAEGGRLVLYAKMGNGTVELLEKQKGQRDRTSTGSFGTSTQGTGKAHQ